MPTLVAQISVKLCGAASPVTADKSSLHRPELRIITFSELCGAPHNVELGAAWHKRSEQDRDYLSAKLDDLRFPAPIYATLTEADGEDGYQLIWSRPNRD
nr:MULTISPECIES: DUF736 family protein [Sinorhizobium/Ensifer group]